MNDFMNPELSPHKRAEALADELTTQQQAEQLTYDAPPIPAAGLPAYNWWNEGLHGVARAGTATVFPQAIGLAAVFDRDVIRRVGHAIATEARAKYNAAQRHGDCDIYKGLTLWTPNINIFRDPRWGRGHETYGECPYLTAELGVEMVKGLQGDGKYLMTAACAKHFAVHSGPESLRHEFDAKASPKDMEETYLPAFKALVTKARVESVMGAYNRVNGEPACASTALFKKLKEWGFNGYFVSDCWAIRDFHEHHMVTSTAAESAAMAIKAGCDINCGNTYLHLLSALKQELISPDDIRNACVHALRTRIRLGQLGKTEYDDIPYEKIACAEHKELALECAEKSAVLLKNNGILPLSRDNIRTLAVIGPNANSCAALYGNYNGTADSLSTFLAGIQENFSGRVLYAEGCHLYKDRTQGLVRAGDRLCEAISAAECADAVILCLGLDATLEGEEGDTGNEFSSGDKKDLRLPESQRELLEKVRAVGKPTVVVLAAGSSVNIEGSCDALIDMWYPGQCGGTALAKILFGDISPSGKLPVTFYKDSDKLPEFTDYSMKNRTYRYCSADNILYPFGYGLTYSRFECGDMKYSAGSVEVTVTNVGGRFTEDVLQLYISSDAEGAPKCSLCGFERIGLEAGESRKIVVPIDDSAFETVDENGVRALRGGKFKLYAGFCMPSEHSGFNVYGEAAIEVER